MDIHSVHFNQANVYGSSRARTLSMKLLPVKNVFLFRPRDFNAARSGSNRYLFAGVPHLP